jgi:RNase adaptor protein for sRNA GlmZ degradation
MRLQSRSAPHVPLRQTALMAISMVGLTAILNLALCTGTVHASSTALATTEPATQTVSAESSPAPAATPATPTVTAPTITIETFGYKFGKAPRGSRFVADVRNIKAGSFTWRQNGLMSWIRKRVMRTSGAKRWHRYFLARWVPRLKNGDKIAIGCSRGHHRSVSLAVVLGADLRARGYKVKFIHRDIKRRW